MDMGTQGHHGFLYAHDEQEDIPASLNLNLQHDAVEEAERILPLLHSTPEVHSPKNMNSPKNRKSSGQQ